eukprot:992356-Prorocentrum_minimum.AAC.2
MTRTRTCQQSLWRLTRTPAMQERIFCLSDAALGDRREYSTWHFHYAHALRAPFAYRSRRPGGVELKLLLNTHTHIRPVVQRQDARQGTGLYEISNSNKS